MFIGELPEEYQKRIMKTVFAKAGSLGYSVFGFAVYGGYGDNVLMLKVRKRYYSCLTLVLLMVLLSRKIPFLLMV